MIKKILIENFMSHKRTVIEPADGLTVLTGPNNCGKSAVVVALQTLCQNLNGNKAFIRHGAKQARITVETTEGYKLEWLRQGEVSYKVNSREVHRVGRDVPEDLHDFLGLPLVEDEGSDCFDVHFADQKAPIFLLDQPGAKAAKFFASSSDAGLLMRMQQKHKANVSDRRAEERLLLKKIQNAKQQETIYEPLQLIDAELKAVERQFASLCDSEENRKALGGLLQAIADEISEKSESQAAADLLINLQRPPVQEDESALRQLLDKSRRDLRVLSTQERVSACTADLVQPPALQDSKEVQELAHQIKRLSRGITRLEPRMEILEAVAAPPALESISDIDRMLSRALELESTVEARRKNLEAVLAEVEELRSEIEAFLKSNPECPVCGGIVDPDKLLSGAGEHVHA